MAKHVLIFAAMAASAISAPATAQGRFDWRPGNYRLIGAGVPILFPELRASPRGRSFVMRNFDRNSDGRISPSEADAANSAFARMAGPRRDQFDWNSHERRVAAEEVRTVPIDVAGGWDRRAMHNYGFRQTPRGATLSLSEDVLFATDSAVLRPGAQDKLAALADYLQEKRGVRIAIDGYTDSRGTDAHNQQLSEHRAAAVRDAFDRLGVVRARFSVVGHGEHDPVATNATAAGMRQNRRVEITLLGRRADEFARY
ncbi:MAG TPA: OmpA family protein [Sphingomonas sp.]|nr:OmpA family protein [Sphingomonas sp.]